MNRNTLSLRSLYLAVLAGLAGAVPVVAHADDEPLPLYLSLAHSITRDSNFSRSDEKQGETINTTALQVGIDKAYGRQTYRGSARLSKSNYAHYGDLLNNDGKSLDGTFSSEFFRNWKLTVDGNYDENLNQIQENNNAPNRVVRNIRTYRDGNVALQYGIGGLYNLVATYDANRLSYSVPAYQYNNANQHSTGLKGIYNSTDLLNFGLGYRLVRTEFPINRNGEEQTDHNIDLSTNWQVTGLSRFGATFTRRTSTFSTDEDRKVRGWTGTLNWNYTPTGLMTYNVNLLRATGADRTKTDYFYDTAHTNYASTLATSNNNVTTTLAVAARMQLTGKVSLNANYNLSRYSIDNSTSGSVGAIPADSQVNDSSVSHGTSIGANYAATRSVNVGCNYKKYSQTAGAYRLGFEGHSVDCTASLLID